MTDREVILTDHAKNDSPVANDKLREMVKHERGQLYKDNQYGDSYHLVQGNTVAVVSFNTDRSKAVVITSFADVGQPDRYRRKKRFSESSF